MTLSEARTLHAYSSWATNKIFETLSSLTQEQYTHGMNSSHGGIHGTMVHLVGAEKVWLERFQGSPQPFLSENPPSTMSELRNIWENVGFDTAKWLGTMSDRRLSETFTMKTLKGETFTHQFGQAFQHLINHSSYHRGQIVTLLRQLGVKPPATDMIVFFRETSKK